MNDCPTDTSGLAEDNEEGGGMSNSLGSQRELMGTTQVANEAFWDIKDEWKSRQFLSVHNFVSKISTHSGVSC